MFRVTISGTNSGSNLGRGEGAECRCQARPEEVVVQEGRSRVEQPGWRFWVLRFWFWVLGFGFRFLGVLGFEFWGLGFGMWVLGFGFWVFDSWFLILGFEYWVLGFVSEG